MTDSDLLREELRLTRESHRLLQETRDTRLVAAEGQSRAATEEARRLDAEVKRLRGALLDLMAVDSTIPHTMRAVIYQALGLPLPGQEGSDVE